MWASIRKNNPKRNENIPISNDLSHGIDTNGEPAIMKSTIKRLLNYRLKGRNKR
jgi:hypothetical protein